MSVKWGPGCAAAVTMLAAAAAAATPAASQSASGAHCEMAATPLAFGRYAPQSAAPADFTATVTVTCSAEGADPVVVEGAVALLGDAAGRRLAAESGDLRYQLYLDPARSRPWGDGAGGGETAPVSGTAGPNSPYRQTITIYGRILARQSQAMVGAYVDQIEAVLSY